MSDIDTEIASTLPLIFDGEDKSCPLKNCMRNNYRHLRKWAKKSQTNCFRIYDRDIKAYPLVIDIYAGKFCIQLFSESRDGSELRQDLKDAAEKALCTLFNISPSAIYWKIRIKRQKAEQYEKLSDEKEFFEVYEHGIKFKINLTDYLDTGLFLDHRQTRQMVAAEAKGKRLLNLFAYTCAFSIQAAAAKSAFTKSVDLSNTYTEWGRDNFLINNLASDTNEIVRADCLEFVKEELFKNQTYDLIVIDPPTLSRSKKMQQMFDIQLDYAKILIPALKLLSADGCLYFSTNSRKFKMDPLLFPDCQVEDITPRTIPLDFHDSKIHRCWRLKKH
jgi:23S rRNA G2069 N7-methylase RlmK/C1962 C5-methylase RlmI